MKKCIVLMILICFICSFSEYRFEILHTSEDVTSSDQVREINTVIKQLVDYFKSSSANEQPLPLPDPFHRPDHVYEHLMMKTLNVTLYGISSLRIENFTSDLVTMEINFNLLIPKLLETGHYTCTLAPCSGKFIFSIINALWYCSAQLQITTSGNLALSNIELDLKHRDDMKINIQNAGLVGLFINNFGDLLFDGMKSFIMGAIDSNLQNYLNEHLKNLTITLPNSLPPLDAFVMEARKLMKNSKYDPYSIPSFQYSNNFLLIEVKGIYVRGISSVYRTGNVKAFMQNHTLHMIANFGITQLEGGCEWEISLPFYSKFGTASFRLDYANFFLNFEQSLNITKKPMINELDVKLGNVQLTLDGSSLVEYIAEFSVNVIANLLRNRIVKFLQTRIIEEVHEGLRDFNLEEVIFNRLSFNDELLPNNKLSGMTESLRSIIKNVHE